MDIKELKLKVLASAKTAIEELIKVLEEPILDGNNGDDLGAEKMKTAAQAKRVAFEDALAILERMEHEENEMAEDGTIDERVKDTTNFAERNSRHGKSK
jgi:hypothetical protein